MTEDPQISPEDRKAVSELILGLIEDSRREERERRLLKATASWLAAFTSFKRMRKQIGLPDRENRAQLLAYGSLLAALKAGGKLLLCQIERKLFDPSEMISPEAFSACVAEITTDDYLLDGGYLTAAIDPDVELLFSEAETKAA